MGIRYTERNAFSLLHDQINKLFREVLRIDPAVERSLEVMEVPPVDICETADEIMLGVELPGIDPRELHVSFVDGKVLVQGVKSEEPVAGRLNYLCMERSFGRFHRVIPIGRAVDVKAAEARYDKGMLIVRLPKLVDKRGEHIAIEVTWEHGEEDGG